MDKPFNLMTDKEKVALRIAQNRAIDDRAVQRRTAPVRSIRSIRVSFMENSVAGFSHAETFPPIAAVIKNLSGAKNEFVGHRRIVAALFDDHELGWLLDQIVARDPVQRSKSWWANSIVSWFSQTIPKKTNPYTDVFERHPTARPYEYRVRQA